MGAVVLEIHQPPYLLSIVKDLGALLSEGWLGGVPHIFNQTRLETTFGGSTLWPAWLAVIPVRGPRLLVKSIVDELKRRFCRRAAVKTLNLDFPEDENGSLDAISPLLEGRPINLALFSMATTIMATDRPVDEAAFDPESGNAGLIHVIRSFQDQMIPRTSNHEIRRSGCSVCVPKKELSREHSTVLLNAHGVGGANATLILQKLH